jgi:FtsP/CotA-like multicopper oxidase with cupredoxin domain
MWIKKEKTMSIFSKKNIKKTDVLGEQRRSRRRFVTGLAGAAAGAGLALSPRLAQAQTINGANEPATLWQPALDPNAVLPIWNPRALPQPGDKIHEFDMELTVTPHEIVPGIVTHMYTYNKTVPGPELRVREGDWIKVNFRNTISEYHTIHFHGMMLANEMDGVPLGTQWPVGKGQTYQYLWRAQPAGTHYYHCHNMTPLHIQAGMFGALIIESDNDPIQKTFPYTRDYTLVLCEHDTNYMEQMMNSMSASMDEMDWMSRHGDMGEMSPLMMGWFQTEGDLKKAIANGYIPPYVSANTGPAMHVDPNFFTINGKSYPSTEPLYIRSGEMIRVRLIGAGAASHYMHLHGHDFWHVAQDGSPLASPIRGNTVVVQPGKTHDIIIYGSNPGNWHFHDHSDKGTTNNGVFPGGMMTMLMYEDARQAGVTFEPVVAVSS